MKNDWRIRSDGVGVESTRPKRHDSEVAAETTEFRRGRAADAKITISAWRCDHCRKYQPMNIASTTVYVEDSGPVRDSGPIVKARVRSIQRMIVDPVCARVLGYVREN